MSGHHTEADLYGSDAAFSIASEQQQRGAGHRQHDEVVTSTSTSTAAMALEEAARAEVLKIQAFNDENENRSVGGQEMPRNENDMPMEETEHRGSRQQPILLAANSTAMAAGRTQQAVALEEAARAEILKVQSVIEVDDRDMNMGGMPNDGIRHVSDAAAGARNKSIQRAAALVEAARAERLKTMGFLNEEENACEIHTEGLEMLQNENDVHMEAALHVGSQKYQILQAKDGTEVATGRTQQAAALEEAARAEVLKTQASLEHGSNRMTTTSNNHLGGQRLGAEKALALLETAEVGVLKAVHVTNGTRGRDSGVTDTSEAEASSRPETSPLRPPRLDRSPNRRRPNNEPGAYPVDGPGLPSGDDDDSSTTTFEDDHVSGDSTSPSALTHPNNDENVNEGLVEARRISDNQQHLSQATPVRESQVLSSSSSANRNIDGDKSTTKKSVVLAVVAVVIVVIVVVVVAAFNGRGNKSGTSHNKTSVAPAYYHLGLPDYTLDVLDNDINGTSPQYQAYQWLNQDPNLTSYSDERLKQRFALAVLYFETNGDAWLRGKREALSIFSTTSNGAKSVGNGFRQRLLGAKTTRGMLRALQPDPTATGGLPPPRPPGCGTPPASAGFGGPGTCDTSVYHVTPGGACRVCPNICPPECNPENSRYKVYEASDCDGEGFVPAGGGGGPGPGGFGPPPGGGPPPQGGMGGDRPPPPTQPCPGSPKPEIGTGVSWLSYMHNECEWFSKNPGPETCDEDGMYIRLNLAANGLQTTTNLPKELALLTRLRLLQLDQNKLLRGTLPSVWFESWQELIVLGIRQTSVRGTIPQEVSLWNSSLEALALEDNQMTGSLPTSLFGLSRLERLMLGSNQFSGTIPGEVLSGLGSLVALRLSENKLSGSIPTEIGTIATLRSFSIDDNDVTGTIPSELGMTSLNHLGVENNRQMSGTIPEELATLPIQTASLKGTNLSGTVPHLWCNTSQPTMTCAEKICGCACLCNSTA